MPRRTLSPIGQFTKWVVVPLVLTAIGYYVAAPRIGTAGLDKAGLATVLPQSQQEAPSEVVTESETPSNLPQPEVEVSVRPASRRIEPDRSERRRARRQRASRPRNTEKPKVEEAEPEPVVEDPVVIPAETTEEPPDEGGSGGAGGTDGGNGGGTDG